MKIVSIVGARSQFIKAVLVLIDERSARRIARALTFDAHFEQMGFLREP